MFWMGEGNELHRRRIERSYAISATEVTVDQFQRFLKERPFKDVLFTPTRSPTPDSPMHGVSWYQAAEYCNWLSEKEGIPKEQWCYVPNKDGRVRGGDGDEEGLCESHGISVADGSGVGKRLSGRK